MDQSDYTTHFAVKSDPATVYAAIVAVRDWWGGEIEGDAALLAASSPIASRICMPLGSG